MIGHLSGKLLEKQAPYLLIDVNGVGYEVSASMTTIFQLPEVGERVSIYTHLSVREDAHVLFGFYQKNERELFRHLIKVNGMGPKMALAILSNVDPDGFVHCINQDDVSSLVKIPGVGKKTAERLIVEMRDRLSKWKLEGVEAVTNGAAEAGKSLVSAEQDAINALLALGYKQAQAVKSVKAVLYADAKSEDLIRAALKQLA